MSGKRQDKSKKHHTKNWAVNIPDELPTAQPGERSPKTDSGEPIQNPMIYRKPFEHTITAWGVTVGAVVAVIYLFQLIAMRESVTTAQDTFNAANRPYIGVNAMDVGFSGEGIPLQVHPTEKTTSIRFEADVKNFGPVPGTGYRGTWTVWLGGVEKFGKPKVPDRPITFFPTQLMSLHGGSRILTTETLSLGNFLSLRLKLSMTAPKNTTKSAADTNLILPTHNS